MYQQLWGYKVEEKLYVGVREQKTLKYHCPKSCTTELQLSCKQTVLHAAPTVKAAELWELLT
jgi:hypothetical protein